MGIIARGQITFSYLGYGESKNAVRSRWIEINGTDSVTQTSDKGSYSTLKTLVDKYANIAGNSVLTFNGKILTYNGYALTYANIGTSELDTYYDILREFLADAGLTDPEEEFENFDWDAYSEHLTNYEDAETKLHDLIYQALKGYTDSVSGDLSAFATTINNTIDDMKGVIDNTIETWFASGTPTTSNYPASGWTSEELKKRHLGDLYYDNGEGVTAGFAYRWERTGTEGNYTYSWTQLQDSALAKALAVANEAKDVADGKRRVFLEQPGLNDAYDVGDLWVNATINGIYKDGSSTENANNDLLRARVAKESGVSFSPLHWQKASKYTDDTKANEVASLVNQWSSDGYISPPEKLALYNYFWQENGVFNEFVNRYENVYDEPIELEQYYTACDTAFANLQRTIAYYVQPKMSGYVVSITHDWSDTIQIDNTNYPLAAHIQAYQERKEAFEAALNNYANSLLETSINNTKDSIAQKLGYNDYADMVAKASQGETIIDGGYLRTGLIDVETLISATAFIDTLISNNSFIKNLIVERLETSGDATMLIGNNEIQIFDEDGNRRTYIHAHELSDFTAQNTDTYNLQYGSIRTSSYQWNYIVTKRILSFGITSSADTIMQTTPSSVRFVFVGTCKDNCPTETYAVFCEATIRIVNLNTGTVTKNLAYSSSTISIAASAGKSINTYADVTLTQSTVQSVASGPYALEIATRMYANQSGLFTYIGDTQFKAQGNATGVLTVVHQVTNIEQSFEIGKNGFQLARNAQYYFLAGKTTIDSSTFGIEIKAGSTGLRIHPGPGLQRWDGASNKWVSITSGGGEADLDTVWGSLTDNTTKPNVKINVAHIPTSFWQNSDSASTGNYLVAMTTGAASDAAAADGSLYAMLNYYLPLS